MFFPDRLRQRRLETGMTQDEVGRPLGLSRSAVNKYERGAIVNVFATTVEGFARVLRCSPGYLMGWTDDPHDGFVPSISHGPEVGTKEDNCVNIGNRIKGLRERRGLTLEQVGSFVGVNKATIQRYEIGNIDIKRATAIRLADCLGSTPSYIMGWTDDDGSSSGPFYDPQQYDFPSILSRLKAAKKAAGMTNDDLSMKSGVAIGTLRKIVSGGTVEPKLPAFMAIASALDVSADWLLFGRSSPVPLSAAIEQLNEEGQKKLLDYASDLIASGLYSAEVTP